MITNYTERLKSYWKSKDLTFIATFKRINSSQGIFDKLMNPEGNMQIYYPTFDDVDVGFRGVQFYHNNNELVDGNYLIQLKFQPNYQSNDNPYSLQVSKIDSVNSGLNEVYERSKQEPDLLIGRDKIGRNNFCYFDNIRFKNQDGKLLNKGGKQIVYVSPKHKLINNQYYSFYTKENKGKLPSAIRGTIVEVKNSIVKSNYNTSDYEGITFYGCYVKENEKFACFENVMFSETGEILMFQGESQKVFVSPNLELKQGGYYQFSFIENEGKLPSAIPNTIEVLENNPYQEYIRLRFERLNNPEANKMIANLMREIGKGMYSSKQRMIFELLQNADDAPGKEKVEFHIDINGDYFFVMHDGAPFNKDDVEAITSATENQKEEVDKEQVVIFNFSVNQEKTLPSPKLSKLLLESELNNSMHSSISLSSLAKEDVFNCQNKA